MNARPTLPILVLALSFLVLVQGCSSDDSTGPGNGGTSPFSGAWDVEGVVTAKQTCGREIGDTLEWEVLIAADGDHGVISFGGPPRELVISGPTATASWLEESAIDVELTLSGGALGGTVTSTSRIGPPGTQVFSLSGTRSETPLSGDFDGYWDLALTSTGDGCELGLTYICSSLYQNGNVVIDAENGFTGEVTGNRLTVHGVERVEAFDQVWTLDMVLDHVEGGLTGTWSLTVQSISNPEISCTSTATVVGTSRQTP